MVEGSLIGSFVEIGLLLIREIFFSFLTIVLVLVIPKRLCVAHANACIVSRLCNAFTLWISPTRMPFSCIQFTDLWLLRACYSVT